MSTQHPTAPHRQIVLDTETTGINPEEGHRVIEIGGVELVNRRLTGNIFHVYINPERQIDQDAVAVHGLELAFLQDKPLFKDIADQLIAFIEGAQLLIHNAPFDVGFLDHELGLMAQRRPRIADICQVVDTLAYARQKHPGQRNSLDALCKRYGVDNSQRGWHGALLDAKLLADVYLLMTCGQFSLLDGDQSATATTAGPPGGQRRPQRPASKLIPATAEELERHHQRLNAIASESGKCLWLQQADAGGG